MLMYNLLLLLLIVVSVNIVLSVILGLCFGTFWLCLWWCYGIPVFSVLLSTLTLGFVIAGITMYGWIGMQHVIYCQCLVYIYIYI